MRYAYYIILGVTYKVSDSGEIFSNYRKKGWIKRKTQINKKGYESISFGSKQGHCGKLVHRVVWEAFNGLIPDNLTINHKNEIKTDNRLSNLELLSNKDNHNYGTRNERVRIILTNGKCSKPVIQYLNEKIINEYPSAREAMRQTNINSGSITSCCNHKYGYKTAGGYKWEFKK